MITLLGLLDKMLILLMAVRWNIISSMSYCVVLSCLWVILVSAVSSAVAVVLHFCAVAHDAVGGLVVSRYAPNGVGGGFDSLPS